MAIFERWKAGRGRERGGELSGKPGSAGFQPAPCAGERRGGAKGMVLEQQNGEVCLDNTVRFGFNMCRVTTYPYC